MSQKLLRYCIPKTNSNDQIYLKIIKNIAMNYSLIIYDYSFIFGLNSAVILTLIEIINLTNFLFTLEHLYRTSFWKKCVIVFINTYFIFIKPY